MGAAAAKTSFDIRHEALNLLSQAGACGETSVKESHEYVYDMGDELGWENSMSTFTAVLNRQTERGSDAEFPEDETSIGPLNTARDCGWMIRWVPAPSLPGLRAVPTGEVCLFRDFATKGLLDGCAHGCW